MGVREILAAFAEGRVPQEIPGDCEHAEELRAIARQLADIRSMASSLARGELEPPGSITSRGPVLGSLKALNAALRHLTWQTQRVAEGDFSQRADFLGEFSSAFNHMVVQLKERASLENRLRQAQKLEAVGRLASGLAHEINTPAQALDANLHFLHQAIGEILATLGDYREALAGLGPLGAPCRARLAEAEASRDIDYLQEEVLAACADATKGVGRIAMIVSAMKGFTQAGNLDRESADLNKVLASALLIAESRYRQVADVRAEYGSIPPVPCYLANMNQAILALLTNAWLAIEDLGRPAERGVISIRTSTTAETVLIEVSDTGCGIAPEVQERLFEPFFTTREVGRGAGLGLTIARAVIVDQHGGRLTFESRPGAGTTFRVELPAGPL